MATASQEAVIRVKDLIVDLKGHRILDGVTLDVFRGEILGFVGASGAGKSVLTRTIIGLLLIVTKRGGMKYALPFGTFLALGAAAAATVGPAVLHWYLGLL